MNIQGLDEITVCHYEIRALGVELHFSYPLGCHACQTKDDRKFLFLILRGERGEITFILSIIY